MFYPRGKFNKNLLLQGYLLIKGCILYTITGGKELWPSFQAA
jgi:hypothetical protein